MSNHTPGAVQNGPGSATTAALMTAVVQDGYGSVEVLYAAQIPRPTVADDQVLIQVRAAGMHIGDWHLMTGQPYLMRVMGFGLRAPRARVRGTDLAGTVVAVGARVTRFQIGDEVYGSGDGTFASCATAREATLAVKPAGLTFEQAAAVPTSGCTALQAVRAAGIGAGQQVLVIGASGGVGLFAVQIAKSRGAEVTAVCSAAKADLVRSVGADHVVGYTDEEVTDLGGRFDVILDLGGTRTLRRLRRILAPRGTLVLVGGEGGGRLVGGAMVRSMRAVVLSPLIRQRLRMLFATTRADDLESLARLAEDGSITPVIDRTYPLSRTADALRHLMGGTARGKVVVTM